MAKISALLFWMGGALTQSLPVLLFEIFRARGFDVNLPALPGFQQAQDDFTLGKIDDLSFFERVCNSANIAIQPEILKAEVLASFTPLPGVVETIDLLPASFQRWLVVDYPRPWFDQIVERLGVHPCFTPARLVFLAESGLLRLVPDVFYDLSRRLQLPMDEWLILDANTKRTVEGLGHGFRTEVFVDARRLEREFLLRGLSGPARLEHRPGFSL